MPKGRISAVVEPDAIKEILAALKTISHHLPALLALSPEDRSGMLKLGPKSEKFVGACRDMAIANPELVPPVYDLPEFIKDVDLFETFNKFAPQIHQLSEGIDDTQKVAGSEAMTTALLLYGTFKDARKIVPGLDGALGELGARFKRGPRKKKA